MVRGKKRTLLLLIEDSPVYTQEIGQLLAAAAGQTFAMRAVGRLAEGLELLDRETFDAVLLEVNLPEAPGMDALRTIRSLHPKIPVIVIFAADDESTAIAAVAEGAQDCLIKGQFDGGRIVLAVRCAIERMGSRQHTRKYVTEIDGTAEERTAPYGLTNKELAERNELDFALFEYNPIETIVVDREGRVVNFNRAKRLSTGGIPKIGDVMYRDFAGKHHTDMRMELMDAMDSGAVKHFPELRYNNRYLAITISPFSRGAIITSQDITAQRVAQEALRESEEKYRLVVENAIDGVVIIQDGCLSYLNPATCAIIGYSEEELLGRRFVEFVAPDDRDDLVREYERKLSGDEFTYPTAVRLIGRDNRPKWVETVGIAVSWEGKPALLSFVRDISDQRRAEDALKESEKKYRELVENIEDIIYIVDSQGTILFANRASERFTGYNKDELVNKNFRDLILPESYGYAGEVFERQVTGEDVGTFELRLMKKNGQVIVLETRERPVWDGDKIVELHGLGRDITDRKRTEEVLRQFEEKWRNFIETSRDVIFITTLEGKVVDINPAGLELSGYTREEFIGREIAESYANRLDREPFIKTIIEKGFVKDLEIDLLKKDGSIAHCLITATQRRDKGGSVIGFQGIIKDITEKKNLEQQLIQAQKMEAIVALAGGISHNFNNILVGIMGYSEYLLSKKGPDDPDAKALKTIHEGTIKASTLVKQLLDAARVGHYHPARIDLNGVISGILPLVQGTFDKSIEIETHLGRQLMIIEADSGQLEQSLLNLCINARDAMPSGGRLIIETVNRQLDKSFADSHFGLKEGAYVVLSVSDTGIGMTPEVSERIFEPFFTTKDRAGGKGMGLATVYGIMKNHSGKITVYSEPGKGTTFRLYFPAAAEQSIDDGTRDERGKATILIIDDDPLVREVWGGFLSEQGFTVLEAEDGLKGIEALSARPDEIDLAVVDLVMPGIGGKQTIRRLKEIKPDIKILGTSGYSANGQAREMASTEVDGFIQKPSQFSELVALVKVILKT